MKEVTPCPEWEQQLSCTHSEDLSSVEQLALMAHVATCSACARTRAHYLETDDLLRSLPPIEPLPSLPTQIQHRRKRKDARVVYFSVHLSITARTVARHADLRQQSHISEAPNSIVVSPSTSVVFDKAGQTSSQPLQKQRMPDRHSRKRFLFPVSPVFLVLMIVGIVASFWGFTVTQEESRRRLNRYRCSPDSFSHCSSDRGRCGNVSSQISILSWPLHIMALLTICKRMSPLQ